MLFALTLSLASAQAPDDPWGPTLARAAASVVSIQTDSPVPFEGESRSNSQATGFVVAPGLLLTNRHVVTAGPVRARAIFANHEEVRLTPVWRDPVHDFGFFSFDPSALSYSQPEPLALAPEAARVGLPIRVLGNDAGEKISILDGTLARLDRPAPSYGRDYNDFNTFYLQAASATSGGSSGSPVLDQQGQVVALNAGGSSRAASSFYLPLDRVVRARDLLLAGRPVPRGWLEARFELEPYDQLRRLGLSRATEDAHRAAFPQAIGMLVVREVLPEGPLAGHLQPGDVLVSLEGQPVPDFVRLESVLDDRVGASVALVAERAGRRREAQVVVEDLFAALPSAYLELGGGVFHDLSLHHARTQQVPTRGVYVAEPGFAFSRDGLPRGAVISQVDGQPTPDLERFAAAMAQVPPGAAVSLTLHPFGAPRQQMRLAVRMDRRWNVARLCRRDAAELWPCQPLPPAPPAEARPQPDILPAPAPDRQAARVAPSLVQVEVQLPWRVAGAPGETYFGLGVVVDAERGWVAVDRDTLPIGLAEAWVVLGGVRRVPAQPVALHPEHNLALLEVEPADRAGLVALPLRAELPAPGERLWQVVLARNGALSSQELVVDRPEPFFLPLDGPPRFRERNLEVLGFRSPPERENAALVDKRGRLVAIHASFSYHDDDEATARSAALPVGPLIELLALARGERLALLPWELVRMPLPAALERGLSATEAEEVLAHDPERRSVLAVGRIAEGSALEGQVEPSDLLLRVEGERVSHPAAVEALIRGRERVKLTLLREGQGVEVTVPTQEMATRDVEEVLLWAGLRLHAPHLEARLAGLPADHPYLSWYSTGSPAARARVFAVRSVLQVGETPVRSLEDFLRAVQAVPAGQAVRLLVVAADGKQAVHTVEPDERFWPTEWLRWTPRGWERQPAEPPGTSP